MASFVNRLEGLYPEPTVKGWIPGVAISVSRAENRLPSTRSVSSTRSTVSVPASTTTSILCEPPPLPMVKPSGIRRNGEVATSPLEPVTVNRPGARQARVLLSKVSPSVIAR